MMEPKTHLQICGMPSLIAPKAEFMSNRSEEKGVSTRIAHPGTKAKRKMMSSKGSAAN
jgi:hypothetical protein